MTVQKARTCSHHLRAFLFRKSVFSLNTHRVCQMLRRELTVSTASERGNNFELVGQ